VTAFFVLSKLNKGYKKQGIKNNSSKDYAMVNLVLLILQDDEYL
jgi:hypothetical protein